MRRLYEPPDTRAGVLHDRIVTGMGILLTIVTAYGTAYVMFLF